MQGNEKQLFSQRLITAMRAQPRARSTRTKHGVDVVALQGVTSVSREMARRYVEGLAIPSPDKLRAISEWLGVSLSWLRDGEGQMRLMDEASMDNWQCMTHKIADPEIKMNTKRLLHAIMQGKVSTAQLEACLLLLLGE